MVRQRNGKTPSRTHCMALALIIFCSIAAVPAVAASDQKTPGSSFTDCADQKCPEMVVIPAGSFEMGSTEEERQQQGVTPAFADHEGPRHKVTLAKPFAMSKFETTRGLYAAFVAETQRPDPASCAVHNAKTDTWEAQSGYSWHNPGFEQTDQEPVACVSWVDARAFAGWLSKRTGKHYRLPSEAEWEYAARGGTTTARYWGDSAEQLCEKANVMTNTTVEKLNSPSWKNKIVCDSPRSFTTPVGSYDANPFGLYDMLGNIFEWVEDCYHKSYDGAPTDGSAWNEGTCERHFLRGGAFHTPLYVVRAATRGFAILPDFHSFAAGFRVARDLD